MVEPDSEQEGKVVGGLHLEAAVGLGHMGGPAACVPWDFCHSRLGSVPHQSAHGETALGHSTETD
jgi:hypothetical protein